MGRLVGSASFFKPGPPSLVGKASRSLTDFILRNAKGKVLDLGGGRGAYSVELKRKGFDVTLGEIDQECILSARAEGLEVIDTSRTRLEDLQGGFDTVMMLEVLEHVEDYESFLGKALGCARKRFLLTVPCNDDFEELFQSGLSYNHIAVSDHVNQFTSRDLSEMLDRTGCSYELQRGDFLFEQAILRFAIHKIKSNPLGAVVSFLLRAYCKLGLAPKIFPSRIFVVVDKETPRER